jgi:hypothetical protein
LIAKNPAEIILRQNEIKRELCVKDVVTDTIIGLRVSGVTNVSNVGAEHLYEVALSCKVQICHF